MRVTSRWIQLFFCGFFTAVLCIIPISHARAQDNYEIQVYGSDLVKPGHTMFELHSNYAIFGSTTVQNGVLPTEHQLHETLEITHGFNDWFETGFYVFTSARYDQGWDYVGSHIRPRWKVPEKYKWPVGFSLSTEFGWTRSQFSPDTWTLEIRPIVDKQLGHWYLAFNPALERSFQGQSAAQGFTFSPAVQVGYDITKKVNLAIEYYGSTGPVFNWDTLTNQEQQIVPSINLNLGAEWEFNCGVVMGLTHSTDNLLVKMIIGRRFNW